MTNLPGDDHLDPLYALDATYFTDEGLVFVCPTEEDARNAYLDGQRKGHNLKLDGTKVLLLDFATKEPHSDRQISA